MVQMKLKDVYYVFRAPGTTQGHAIIENAIEHLATVQGLDPIELRLKNMLKPGDKLISGDVFEGPNFLPEIINHLLEKADFRKRQQEIIDFNKVRLLGKVIISQKR